VVCRRPRSVHPPPSVRFVVVRAVRGLCTSRFKRAVGSKRKSIESVYATWCAYMDPENGEGGQWKMWRLRPDSSVNDRDGEILSSHWYVASPESTIAKYLRRSS